MLKKILTLAIPFFCSVLWVDVCEINRNGVCSVEEGLVKFGIAHYSAGWKTVAQQGDRRDYNPQTVSGKNTETWSGPFSRWNGKAGINLKQTVYGKEKNFREITYELTSVQDVPTAATALQIEIPEWFARRYPIQIDGTEYRFPQKSSESPNFAKINAARGIEIPLKRGLLTLNFAEEHGIQLVDCRKFGKKVFLIRCLLDLFEKNRRTGATLRLRVQPYRFEPVDFRKQANADFSDKVPDDQKGGWTDQGPNNDLRTLPHGMLDSDPVQFRIESPEKNKGKACIVLGGATRKYFPSAVEIPYEKKGLRNLFLLHAIAWSPKKECEIGNLIVSYGDHSRQIFPVQFGRDVADWWKPYAHANARVGWKGTVPESEVGLYVSKFELSGRPVRKIRLESNGKSVWMIAGISASRENVTFSGETSYLFQRNGEWRATGNVRDILKGSALDFSFLSDAPAGKYGRVLPRDGRFVFEKTGKPVRFYGANLCFSANYPDRKRAEELAERLSRIGYNAVRLHHYDRELVQNLPANSVTFNLENLDRLDYLVFQLKKHGVYINTDLFTARTMKPGEFKTFPTLSDAKEYKIAAMFFPEVNRNLKTFAKTLLTHKNPYTGMTWAEDPVLTGLSFINENTVQHVINFNRESPVYKGVRALFREHCRQAEITVDDSNREAEFRRFLEKSCETYYRDMAKFVRDLGVKCPITDQNYVSSPNVFRNRLDYDYVDSHSYWDHPEFIGIDWQLPLILKNESSLKSGMPNALYPAPSRIFGKPFTVTEFDYCAPNSRRAEGGILFGAVAARQDWSAIYRFAYSHHGWSLWRNSEVGTFDVVNDPARLLTERIGVAFFRRGDLPVAKKVFAVVLPGDLQKEYRPRYPEGIRNLALLGRIGSCQPSARGFVPEPPAETCAFAFLEKKEGPVRGKPVLYAENGQEMTAQLVKNGIITPGSPISDGPEVFLDFKAGIWSASSPLSEGMVVPEGKSVNGVFMKVRSVKSFAAMGAVSLDSRPLPESQRILIVHALDAQTEHTKFASEEMRMVLAKNPKGAVLAKHGVAEIRLARSGRDVRLFALDFNGARLQEVPVRESGDGIAFQADSFAVPGKVVFAYELVMEGSR